MHFAEGTFFFGVAAMIFFPRKLAAQQKGHCMSVTIPPECQTLLDQFEADAEAARTAKETSDASQTALAEAQIQADHDMQASLDAHEKAVASGQAFVYCLVPPTPPPPMPAGPAKK
jgi:hypothetical protein